MKILLVLVLVSVLAYVGIRLISKKSDFRLAIRIALSAVFLLSALGSVITTSWLQTLIPNSFEISTERSMVAGVIELILAIGLQVNRYQKLVGWILIGYLILILPPILSSSISTIYYNPQSFDTVNQEHLWLRIPIQFLLIFCVYISTIRNFSLRKKAE